MDADLNALGEGGDQSMDDDDDEEEEAEEGVSSGMLTPEEVNVKIEQIIKFQNELLGTRRGADQEKRTELYRLRNEIGDYVATIKQSDLKKIGKMNSGAGRVIQQIKKDQHKRHESNVRFRQAQNMRAATKARLTTAKVNNVTQLESLLDGPTMGTRIQKRENDIVAFSLAAAICRHVKEDLPSFRYGDASGMVNAVVFGARYASNRQDVILSKLNLSMPN